MIFDLNEHELKINKIVSEKFNSSFMSNSKWKKLFSALDLDDLVLKKVRLKCVDARDSYETYMPKKEDLEEVWVAEGANHYKYFYKEIEWIELIYTVKPSNMPAQYYNQSIDEAENIIRTIGQFVIERTEDGLRIYGYKT